MDVTLKYVSEEFQVFLLSVCMLCARTSISLHVSDEHVSDYTQVYNYI